jgi:hypothetical protein
MHRIYPIGLLLFLFLTGARSQATFQGCVTDPAGEPLIGVSIIEALTGVGTATDLDGCFALNGPQDTLEVYLSYVGFEQREVILRAGRENHFTLEPAASHLEEVVISRYSAKMTAGRAEGVALRSASAPPPPPPPPPAPAAMSMSRAEYRRATARVEAAPTVRYDDASDRTTPMPTTERGVSGREERAGQLTAGEVNDFGKWDMWHDIGGEDLARYHDIWQLYARHRYAVLLGYPGGTPAAGIPVALHDRKGRELWRSVTDNTGRAELWAGLFPSQQAQWTNLTLVADPGPAEVRVAATAFSGEQGRIQYLELPGPCYATTAIDIAYVVDATGSMSDEIAFLQAELADVIGRIKDSLPTADLQLGSVFYRDQGDDYLTRISPFSHKIGQTVAFIKGQQAGGGGDTPEAVEDALIAAVDSLAWRPDAMAKLLFLVLDAPPHSGTANLDKLHAVTRRAAARGIRIVPVACSGIDKSTEYLLRNLALATNGTYTFLTDDSGIGNPHIEPTTDLYEVEKLNDLLVRLSIQFGRPVDCGASLPDPVRPLASTSPDESAQLRGFPNPTLGPVTVTVAEPGGTLLLNDPYGRVLEAYRATGPTVDLDLVQYPAGTYYLNYHHPESDAAPITLPIVRTGAR